MDKIEVRKVVDRREGDLVLDKHIREATIERIVGQLNLHELLILEEYVQNELFLEKTHHDAWVNTHMWDWIYEAGAPGLCNPNGRNGVGGTVDRKVFEPEEVGTPAET